MVAAEVLVGAILTLLAGGFIACIVWTVIVLYEERKRVRYCPHCTRRLGVNYNDWFTCFYCCADWPPSAGAHLPRSSKGKLV